MCIDESAIQNAQHHRGASNRTRFESTHWRLSKPNADICVVAIQDGKDPRNVQAAKFAASKDLDA
jgi:hypothetical protein